MSPQALRSLLFLGWVAAVCLAALAIGVTSTQNWIIVAVVAIGPALVAQRFWRVPEQTISESIHDARD